jgi:hypothetical protein
MNRKAKAQIAVLFVASILLGCICGDAMWAKTVVNVAKHIVKGSGVTPAQMENQFNKYKETWDSPDVEHRQVGGVDEVNNVGEGKTAGAINIYGTDYNLPANSPGNPGYCVDQNYIVIGPNCPNDTGAHEGVHWGGAKPDDTNDCNDHGTPIGHYPTDPCYSGYDTDGDGDCDGNDVNNIAFPGKGRKGSQTDPNQRKRYGENIKTWVDSQLAIGGERGKDMGDAVGDVLYSFMDITTASAWGLGTNEMDYMLSFKMLLKEYPLMGMPVMLGFYLETDQSCQTGEPPEGLDYFVGYDTFAQEVIFQKYELGGWMIMPQGMVQLSHEYLKFDGPFVSIPIGLRFTLPLMVLQRGANELLSYRAVARDMGGGGWEDRAPDIGLVTILTKPMPPKGIEGDLDSDNDVDMHDFAIFAENWLVGTGQ